MQPGRLHKNLRRKKMQPGSVTDKRTGFGFQFSTTENCDDNRIHSGLHGKTSFIEQVAVMDNIKLTAISFSFFLKKNESY